MPMKICIIWIIVALNMIYFHGKRKIGLILLVIHLLIQVKVTQFELLIILKQLLVLMAQRRIKSCLRGRLEVETFYKFQKRAKSRI